MVSAKLHNTDTFLWFNNTQKIEDVTDGVVPKPRSAKAVVTWKWLDRQHVDLSYTVPTYEATTTRHVYAWIDGKWVEQPARSPDKVVTPDCGLGEIASLLVLVAHPGIRRDRYCCAKRPA